MRKGLRKLVFVFAIAVAVMGLIPTAENTASADEIISCYRGENTGCLVCLVRTDTGKIKVVVYQCP